MKRTDRARAGGPGALPTSHATRADAVVGVLSVALTGLDAHLVRVAATNGEGAPGLLLMGLPEHQAREARVRVRAALQQIGVEIFEHALTVTFEPKDLPVSSALDLSIALAVLVALGEISPEQLDGLVVLGELSLTGTLRPVRGVLPALRGAVAQGIRRAIVPTSNAREASHVEGLEVLVAEHLGDVIRHLREGAPLEPAAEPSRFESAGDQLDLIHLRGQQAARRALEIAAAGAHSLLMIGPPGSAKTTLARRLPGLLPPMSKDEALTITEIYSVAGLLRSEHGLISHRTFRAPHFTVSLAGLLGGGDPVRPGEVSLAHQGVLFLDELTEFRRSSIEELRRVLERGEVTIVRARQRVTFPAKPLLVGAIQPCPCGFAGTSRCACSPDRIAAHQQRISQQLRGLFDLRLVLPSVDAVQLQREPRGEASSVIRERVVRARARQAERSRTTCTASKAPLSVESDTAASKVLAEATQKLGLSERDRGRVLRVARTIADLDDGQQVRALHLAEALPLTFGRDGSEARS